MFGFTHRYCFGSCLLLGVLFTATASAQTITGTVFRDYDASGTRGGLEPGVGGISVTAYDSSGASVGSTASLLDGTYSLAVSVGAGTALRIEFTNVPGFLQSGAIGAGSRSRVTFRQSGDSGVDLALQNPAQYCNQDPLLATPCWVSGDQIAGDGAGIDALVTLPYNGYGQPASAGTDRNQPSNPVPLAVASQIGTTWGLAYQRESGILLAAAAVRRHTGFAAAGPGAIYSFDTVAATPPALFLDLNALLPGMPAGVDPHTSSVPPLNNVATPSSDAAAFDAIGKSSFGDIELSEDDQTLWVVNLTNKTLLEMPIGIPAAAPTAAEIVVHNIPAPAAGCTNGEFRPWGLGAHDGLIYVGGVCTAENGGTAADLFAYVYTHDPSGAVGNFTEIYSLALAYTKGRAVDLEGLIGPGAFTPGEWQPWRSVWDPSLPSPPDGPVGPTLYSAPQPILADITLDVDGSLILGFLDRFGMQSGYRNYDTVNNTAGSPLYSGATGGDLVRVCNVISGGTQAFFLEGTPQCPSNLANGEGPGGGEFYPGEQAPIGFGFDIHPESSWGAVAHLFGSGEVVTTMADPIQTWSGGIGWLSNANGAISTTLADGGAIPAGSIRRYQVFTGQTGGGETGIGKAAGLGDLEILCPPPPLEIGNRVWCDGSGNGVQDAGENGVGGISVVLTCGAETLTATTAADGSYLFTDADYLVAHGSRIPRGTACTVSIDTVANGAALAMACGTAKPSPANNGGADAAADLRDSDGVDVGAGVVTVAFTTGGSGENDHSYDFGFVNITQDWGDAPDSYATTSMAGGPAHDIVDGFSLGPAVDSEGDGQPGPGADGDDTAGSDDEDGVTFAGGTAMAAACEQSSVSVELTNTAGTASPQLDAWIDFNRNGVFDDPAEHLFGGTAVALSTGVNSLNYMVPCSAVAGASYARFRLSSGEELLPGGTATAGEVEDYVFALKADFGDAPASYGTAGAGAASHGVIAGYSLGGAIDAETDGAPSAGADGDDLAGTPDDEDGVAFPGGMAMAAACATTSVDVTLTNGAGVAGAFLDGWIDFNNDGTFDHPAEHLFGGTSTALAAGNNTLTYTVPCDVVPADSYARFRLSAAGGLGATGAATEGEVEDYPFQVKGIDLGDAPDSYLTTMAAGGASHTIIPGFQLGSANDHEPDGQPTPAADGDDSDAGGDDEDGVAFPGGMAMAGACETTDVTVTLTNTAGMAQGFVDAWIDFDGNGSFDHPAEHLFGGASMQLNPGANTLSYMVPCAAQPQATSYARFRLSSVGGTLPGGTAADGEVEDYLFQVKGVDFGDAPDSYGTTIAATGATHTIVPGFQLGAANDTESDGQPSPNADGDDTDPEGDDEDGIAFPGGMAMAAACESASVDVTLVNTAGFATAFVDGWIDYNGDGTFDHPAEHIFAGASMQIPAGTSTLNYTVPCDVAPSASYARFRLSSTGGLTPTGGSADGEVEDYAFLVKGVDWGDAPDTFGTSMAASGPAHVIVMGYQLGSANDTEPDGQPTAGADGDDTDADGDDEDGVDFGVAGPMAAACSTGNPLVVTLDDTAGVGTASLDGWIDFNGDGAFDHPAEHLFAGTSAPLAVGANNMTFDVPCDVVPNAGAARFRLSSAGGLMPTDAAGGPAADGEVEDYAFEVKGIDLGDAPDSYATTMAAGGAMHTIIPGYSLGAANDTEPDGQPTALADGDDLDADGDDEDGVVIGGGMAMAGACTAGNTLDVTLNNTAGLATSLFDAWIDFDGNGLFDHPAEHLFGGISQALVLGGNTLTYSVPCDAVPQLVSFARFRLSSAGNLAPDGITADGEVEDYAIQIKGVDYGDAVGSYATTLVQGGPSHTIVPGFQLGAANDTEPDGQPTIGADGDDTDADGDDEDGVGFAGGMPMAHACAATTVSVELVNTAGVGLALLDAWIDFNRNGLFDHPAEHLFAGTSAPLVAGVNSLPFDIPCDVVPGASVARFRLSSVGGLPPNDGGSGPVIDGEVEDYTFLLKGLDYGDAPAGYPTLLADDGARHVVLANGNPTLGTQIDTEADGQPNANHMGDDLNGTPDDEDGVTFAGVMVQGGAPVDISVAAGATGGLLNAWIDFNADGDWNDPGEQIAADLDLAGGSTTVLSVAAPPTAVRSTTCARFRISSQPGLSPTGLAPDGEIEDHSVGIGPEDPMIGLAKQLLSVDNLGGGDFQLVFEMLVTNSGNVKLSNVQTVTDLATAFADAGGFVVDSVTAVGVTPNPAFDGDTDTNLLAGTDMLEAGEVAVVTLTVILTPDGFGGPYVCSSTASATSPTGAIVTDVSQDGGDPDPDGNGDPGDNGDPTVFNLPLSAVEIPTLSEWGLLFLALILGFTAVLRMRRRYP